jgi:hypothetical protein
MYNLYFLTININSFLLLCIKKDYQQKILHGMLSLAQNVAYLLAHIHVCMCSNGHPMGPGQEGPRREHTIGDIGSPVIVVCLKDAEHGF